MDAGWLLDPEQSGMLVVLAGIGLAVGLLAFALFGGADERRTSRRVKAVADRLAGRRIADPAAAVLKRRRIVSKLQSPPK